MVKSMTGYGKAQVLAGTKTITVEVRALNSKQLDLGIKIPPVYRSSEYELRAAATQVVGRGKVDVWVTVENNSATSGVSVNAELFGAYFRQISAAAKASGLALGGLGFDSATLTSAILRLPEVMTSEAGDAPEEEKAALVGALAEALVAFDGFRAGEGAVLLKDIMARVSTIEELMGQVEPFEKARTEVVRARILENIASVGVVVDSNRLEQEMIFWIEKLDITEEKVRLAKHCDYFRQTAASDEDGVGRKLGFVAQEMGREINTLGSKANDAEIQKRVVQMKDELEKIKEQLLNIL